MCEYINEIPFIKYATDDERQLIKNNISKVKYTEGQVVYSADSQCPGVIFVKNGELRTYMLSQEGKEVTLYRLHAGDVCALSASCIIQSITFDIYIDACKDTDVYLINAKVMRDISKDNIYIENYILNNVVEKFSDAMWQMNQILFMPLEKRLAIFLYEESIYEGSLELKITHEQISKYIGSAREVVTRMLKKFKEDGIVDIDRNVVKIIDKQKLSMLAKT